jgi:hypothetical protein
VVLGNRRLVLTPTVSGAGASIFDSNLADQVWLGYPVSGLSTLWLNSDTKMAEDVLGSLLGPVRARLLHLAGPLQPMSWLARSADCAPNSATYHCSHLVNAGLLYRERRGRHIYVGRTERGSALIDLLVDARL